MKSTQIFQKFFYFFLFLAIAAGCRSSQQREESDCGGLPAKNEILVAQVEQPVKQEVKAVPPIQEKTEVAQVPVEKKAPTARQSSQAKTLLAQIQRKLVQARGVEAGEKRQPLLDEVRALGRRIEALAQGGDKEAAALQKGRPYQVARQLYRKLRNEKPAKRVLVERKALDFQPKSGFEEGEYIPLPAISVREEAPKSAPQPQNEARAASEPPTAPKGQKAPENNGTPTWPWVALGLLAAYILACLVNRQCEARKLPERAGSDRLVEAAARIDASKKAAETRDRQRGKLEAKAEQRRAVLETRLATPAEPVTETTEPPQKEEGEPEGTPAVEGEKQARLSERDLQKLLGRIREAGMKYPAGTPALKQALKEARAAEREYEEACDKLSSLKQRPNAVHCQQAVVTVAAEVKKAGLWLRYWQKASEGAAEGDLKTYCQAKREKAERDLAKAQKGQKEFEAKKAPLQKNKGGKKCKGKKK